MNHIFLMHVVKRQENLTYNYARIAFPIETFALETVGEATSLQVLDYEMNEFVTFKDCFQPQYFMAQIQLSMNSNLVEKSFFSRIRLNPIFID